MAKKVFVTKETKAACGAASPPWQLRLTEPIASETNGYLHFGDRKGERERFMHQVSHPEYLQYDSVTFSHPGIVRGKDTEQCRW